MDKDEQIRQEAISELEASMGGRFRDGAECPQVFDIYALADAELHHADLPENADALREHLQVCPVCHLIYSSALSADSDVEPLPVAQNSSLPESSKPTSMLDGLRDLVNEPSHEPSGKTSDFDSLVVVTPASNSDSVREVGSALAMALHRSQPASTTDALVGNQLFQFEIRPDQIEGNPTGVVPSQVRLRISETSIELSLIGWSCPTGQTVRACLRDASNRELCQLQPTTNIVGKTILATEIFDGWQNAVSFDVRVDDEQQGIHWQLRNVGIR